MEKKLDVLKKLTTILESACPFTLNKHKNQTEQKIFFKIVPQCYYINARLCSKFHTESNIPLIYAISRTVMRRCRYSLQ